MSISICAGSGTSGISGGRVKRICGENGKDRGDPGFGFIWMGAIKIEENYQAGKLNGVLRRYYDNGVVQEEANYRDDQLDGDRFLFQKNKEMERFEVYSDGDLLGFCPVQPV